MRQRSGFPPTRCWLRSRDRLRTPEDPLDGLARVRGLTRQPERTLKEILHVQGREMTLSTTARAHVANVLDALVLLGLDFLLLELTALVAGVRATEVLRVAAPSMIALFVADCRALLRAARRPRARDGRIASRAYVG